MVALDTTVPSATVRSETGGTLEAESEGSAGVLAFFLTGDFLVTFPIVKGEGSVTSGEDRVAEGS